MNEDGKWNLMGNKLLSFLPAAINQLLIMITKGNINARRLIAIIIFVKLRTFALPLHSLTLVFYLFRNICVMTQKMIEHNW